MLDLEPTNGVLVAVANVLIKIWKQGPHKDKR